MKTLIFLLLFLLSSLAVISQVRKYEIQEIKGEILSITSGFSFAYSALNLKRNEDTVYFRFPPEYGELITGNFKRGSTIELRGRVVLNTPLKIRKIAAIYHFQDEIIEIKINDKWIKVEDHRKSEKPVFKVFIEKKVRDEFIRELTEFDRAALLFDDDVVAFMNPVFLRKNEIQNIKVGDIVSFIGYEHISHEGYVYPKWRPKGVYAFSPLIKAQGTVKSYLHKQNYVYIGLVLQTNSGELQLSFPSDMAKQVKEFVDQHSSVTAYHSIYRIEGTLDPSEMHALVSEKDTLRIGEFGFYGGADVKHDHVPAEIEGKISSINKSNRGKIMSVIVGNDCYIEIDYNIEKQLGTFLKRGNTIKVSGQERIKKEGEIYSKDYRIITPIEITIADKAFLINQLPQ